MPRRENAGRVRNMTTSSAPRIIRNGAKQVYKPRAFGSIPATIRRAGGYHRPPPSSLSRGLGSLGVPRLAKAYPARCGSGLLPRHQPRFPVEFRGFPGLHPPFLKRKAHTWSCPELRTGNRGSRRVPHAATAGKSICASRGSRSHPSRSLRRVGQANLTLSPPTTADITESKLSHQERSGDISQCGMFFREC